jgi:hypothetical protein
MFTSIILIALAFSFCLQIFVIIEYLVSKSQFYYRTFIGTFIVNTILMVIISIIALNDPASMYRIDIKLILWLLSGFVLISILLIKISTFIKIVKRAKDPVNYTINFSGKKIYENGIVKKYEFAIFALSIPIFLFAASYFVARLINMIFNGQI